MAGGTKKKQRFWLGWQRKQPGWHLAFGIWHLVFGIGIGVGFGIGVSPSVDRSHVHVLQGSANEQTNNEARIPSNPAVDDRHRFDAWEEQKGKRINEWKWLGVQVETLKLCTLSHHMTCTLRTFAPLHTLQLRIVEACLMHWCVFTTCSMEALGVN